MASDQLPHQRYAAVMCAFGALLTGRGPATSPKPSTFTKGSALAAKESTLMVSSHFFCAGKINLSIETSQQAPRSAIFTN